MNAIRTSGCLLTALLLAALAFPAAAAKTKPPPDKTFAVEFLLPPTDLAGLQNPRYEGTVGQQVLHLPVTVTVFVKNESPPSTASSNVSSLRFDLSGLVVVGVDCPRANCGVTGNTVLVTNISSPIQAQEVYPVTLSVNSCVVVGEATISNVHAFTGSQFTGNEFNLTLADPVFPDKQVLSKRSPDTPFDFTQAATFATTGIRCGDGVCDLNATVPNIDLNNPSHVVQIVRGNDTDGSCNTSVDYFVTNNLATAPPLPLANKLHANWSAPSFTPVFAYKVTRVTATSPWEVGWLPKPGESITFPAQPCLNTFPASTEPTVGQLPFPTFVGLLSQDLKANATKIKVDTASPPTITGSGLPIMIDHEWMLVTAVGTNSWDVVRLPGATFHGAGAAVATTTLQRLTGTVPSPYSTNMAAQICQVWESADHFSAWFIDGSDGWVLGR